MKTSILWISLCLSLLVGCGNKVDSAKLEGTWKLVKVEPDSLRHVTDPFIRFKDGKIETPELTSGRSTVLSCAMPYEKNGNKLRIKAGRYGNCTSEVDIDFEIEELTDTKLMLSAKLPNLPVKAFTHYVRSSDQELNTSGTSRGNPTRVDPTLNTYFQSATRRLSLLQRIELKTESDDFTWNAYYEGQLMVMGGARVSDGSFCAIMEKGPRDASEPRDIAPQVLRNSRVMDSDGLLRASGASNVYAYAIEVNYQVAGEEKSGMVACLRQESMGRVTMDDFKRHFRGIIQFQ